MPVIVAGLLSFVVGHVVAEASYVVGTSYWVSEVSVQFVAFVVCFPLGAILLHVEVC